MASAKISRNPKPWRAPDSGGREAGALGTTPQLWMNLQTNYDLAKARPEKQVKRIAAAG